MFNPHPRNVASSNSRIPRALTDWKSIPLQTMYYNVKRHILLYYVILGLACQTSFAASNDTPVPDFIYLPGNRHGKNAIFVRQIFDKSLTKIPGTLWAKARVFSKSGQHDSSVQLALLRKEDKFKSKKHPFTYGITPDVLFHNENTQKLYCGESHRKHGDRHDADKDKYDDYRVKLTTVSSMSMDVLLRKHTPEPIKAGLNATKAEMSITWCQIPGYNFLHFFKERTAEEEWLFMHPLEETQGQLLQNSDNTAFKKGTETFLCREKASKGPSWKKKRKKVQKLIDPQEEMNVWYAGGDSGIRQKTQKLILELVGSERVFQGRFVTRPKGFGSGTVKLLNEATIFGNFLTVYPNPTESKKNANVLLIGKKRDSEVGVPRQHTEPPQPVFSESEEKAGEVDPLLPPAQTPTPLGFFAKYSCNHRSKTVCGLCRNPFSGYSDKDGTHKWSWWITTGRHLCTKCGLAIGECCGEQIDSGGWFCSKKWVCSKAKNPNCPPKLKPG